MSWISTVASLGSASTTRSLVLFFLNTPLTNIAEPSKTSCRSRNWKRTQSTLVPPSSSLEPPLQILPTFKRNLKLNSWVGEVNACPGLVGAPSSPLLLNPYRHTLCPHSMYLTKFVISLIPSLGGSSGSPRNKRASSLLGEPGTNSVSRSEWAVLGLRKSRI